MYSNCSSCSAAYSYDAAHKLFTSIPQPRGKAWSADERPLDDNRKHHYRVVQGPNADWYDMVLYRTVMARYHRPTADGARRVLYSNDSRTTSSAFMWRVLNTSGLLQEWTTDNVSVAVPLYYYDSLVDPWAHQSYNPPKFSAALWFDANGKLDVSKSQHTPHYRRVSSAEDKAQRAALKEKFANLLFLAQMRLPESEREVDIDYYAGRPFGAKGPGWQRYPVEDHVRVLCKPGFALANATSAQMEAFFAMCQAVYDTLASKRAYNQRIGRRWSSTMPSLSELKAPITPDDFKKSMTAKLVAVAGLNDKTGKVPLPQFMPYDEYPRSNVCAG